MNKNKNKQTSKLTETPYFPYEELNKMLPEELLKLLEPYFNRQRDILLFSILHVLSGCFPKVFGYYFGNKVLPNIFGIVGGPPASGKNAMLLAKLLGDDIHSAYKERYEEKCREYKLNLALYLQTGTGEKPSKPQLELFYIPGNSSSAGIQLILSSTKRGIIIESEVDTLIQIFDQKFGNYSDILRKIYHHEPISYFRKTDNEYVLIENACLSVLLSGTPEQLLNLLKSGENGIFSRFCFYVLDSKPKFSDPFLGIHRIAFLLFKEYAKEVMRIHFELLDSAEKEFRFTENQKKRFNEKFPEIVDDFYEFSGNEGVSIVMRLGIIFFRIAMILTVVRNHKGDILTCNDKDFDATNLIVDVLKSHSLAVYSTLPSNDEPTGNMLLASDILKILPEEFKFQQLMSAMARMSVSKRQTHRIVDQLITEGKLERFKLGLYRKINNLK